MVVPRVLSVREVRNQVAEVFAEAARGAVVYAGAHRRPEVVIMSVEQYEQLQLTAEQERELHNVMASWAMEGQRFTDEEKAALREFVAGRISREECLARVLPAKYAPPA